jgi:hypothetical protein
VRGGDGNLPPPHDPCADGAGCDHNALCTTSPAGKAECTCRDGYQGDGKTCAPGPCLGGGGCDKNATCSSTGSGTRQCTCNSGYRGTGEKCDEINACLETANGGCDAAQNRVCLPLGPGLRACACADGYEDDGGQCVKIRTCTPQSFKATCSAGDLCYTYTGSGYADATFAKTDCESDQGDKGTFNTGDTCNKKGGGCLMRCGKEYEMIMYYDPSFLSSELAKDACLKDGGVWLGS